MSTSPFALFILGMSSARPALGYSNKRGFTLMELLGVIAIVGLLAAIVVPSINQAMTSARRSRDAAHLRQVCLAYTNFAQTAGQSRTIPANRVQSVHDWAAWLAYYTRFNDAAVYFATEDPALPPSSLRAQAVLEDLQNQHSIRTDFAALSPSIAVVAGLPANASAKTPIAWTRGLRRDGFWEPQTSPYAGQGGYIGFLDGHVQWFSSLSDPDNPTRGLLTKYNSGSPTSDIYEAVGASQTSFPVKVLESSPQPK